MLPMLAWAAAPAPMAAAKTRVCPMRGISDIIYLIMFVFCQACWPEVFGLTGLRQEALSSGWVSQGCVYGER